MRYVGSSFGDSTNTRETPAHTQVDAALRYQRGAVQGSVNVTNLFDQEYYSICYRYGGCAKGGEREVQPSLDV